MREGHVAISSTAPSTAGPEPQHTANRSPVGRATGWTDRLPVMRMSCAFCNSTAHEWPTGRLDEGVATAVWTGNCLLVDTGIRGACFESGRPGIHFFRVKVEMSLRNSPISQQNSRILKQFARDNGNFLAISAVKSDKSRRIGCASSVAGST